MTILRVLVFQENTGDKNRWVAQCLEHDIAAQADSVHALEIELQRMIGAQILGDAHNKVEPVIHLSPAPQVYWKRWEEGKDCLCWTIEFDQPWGPLSLHIKANPANVLATGDLVALGDVAVPGDDGPCHGMPGKVVRIFDNDDGVPTAEVSYGMVAVVPLAKLYPPGKCPPLEDLG